MWMRDLTPFLLLLLIQPAFAGPAARVPVARLTAASDAIVIGSCKSTVVNGAVNATIQVERALKGPFRTGGAVSVAWTSASSGHGVFFLKRDANRSWSLLPATNGDARWEDTYLSTPASVPEALRKTVTASLPPNASTLDRVLVEMVIAAESGGGVPYELVNIFRDHPSPVLAAAFTRFRAKQNPVLAFAGLSGEVLKGDPSTIVALRRDYAALSVDQRWGFVLDNIRWYYRNTEPRAIRALGDIAIDSKAATDLRVAVASALARTHTQPALPYLAALLSDENRALRALGVGGLSMFANNVEAGSHAIAPGEWSYRSEETIAHSAGDEAGIAARERYYIDFWLNWWQKHRSALEC